jgi:hypothetical protein
VRVSDALRARGLIGARPAYCAKPLSFAYSRLSDRARVARGLTVDLRTRMAASVVDKPASPRLRCRADVGGWPVGDAVKLELAQVT